MQQKTKNGTV